MSAVETIREWLENGNSLPEESDLFFKMWVLLNAYYNENYTEAEERDRVLHFGKDFDYIFNILDTQVLRFFIAPECVGEGKHSAPPNEYIKKASEVLKNRSGISYNCENCRSDKKRSCQNIMIADYRFQDFEALIRILYQIRCNLFHGDKLDGNELQRSRNRELITNGNIILQKILEEIVISATVPST